MREWTSVRDRFARKAGPPSRELLSRAAALRDDPLADPPERVVVHGDLHHANVLSSDPRGWLAIDPKGPIGEKAFDVPSYLLNPEPLTLDATRLRNDGFVERLGLDRGRLVAWSFVRSVASACWTVEDRETGWERAIAFAEEITRRRTVRTDSLGTRSPLSPLLRFGFRAYRTAIPPRLAEGPGGRDLVPEGTSLRTASLRIPNDRTTSRVLVVAVLRSLLLLLGQPLGILDHLRPPAFGFARVHAAAGGVDLDELGHRHPVGPDRLRHREQVGEGPVEDEARHDRPEMEAHHDGEEHRRADADERCCLAWVGSVTGVRRVETIIVTL